MTDCFIAPYKYSYLLTYLLTLYWWFVTDRLRTNRSVSCACQWNERRFSVVQTGTPGCTPEIWTFLAGHCMVCVCVCVCVERWVTKIDWSRLLLLLVASLGDANRCVYTSHASATVTTKQTWVGNVPRLCTNDLALICRSPASCSNCRSILVERWAG